MARKTIKPTLLPATIEHAQALQYVKETARWLRDDKMDVLGIEVALLDPDDNVLIALELFALSDPGNMMSLVRDARNGSKLAQEALEDLLRRHYERGVRLPVYLAAYQMDLNEYGRPPWHSRPKKNSL